MPDLRVLLIGAEDEENLAIRYLVACLEKEGFNAEIAPCGNHVQIPNCIKTVKRFNPGLIGIALPFQSMAKIYFNLVGEIRKSGFKGHITLGGHFPTFEYKKILESQQGIDSVIRFEGEEAIVSLANSLESNSALDSVPNLVYRKGKVIKENEFIKKFPDLGKLPFPKRLKDAQFRLGEKFATLVGSRGCWHSRCLFCCIGAFHSRKEGGKIALRSAESIAEEISLLYFGKGVRLFQLHDDNFLLPTFKESIDRLDSIKNALEEKKIDCNNIAFLIKARPDSINDDVASALKDLGTVGVFLGVENASDSGLKALIRGQTREDINRAIAALEKCKIPVTFNLLIFHPNAKMREIKENISFMKKNLQHSFDFGRAEIVAGSPLESLLINEKGLLGNWPRWNYKIKDAEVEKIFQINLKTFRKKGSCYEGMVHSSIALAYQAGTLQKLHPGKIAEELAAESSRLIREINSFTAGNVERIATLAKQSRPKEIEEFSEALEDGCRNYKKSIKKISSRMLRLAIADRVFASFGVREYLQGTAFIRRIFFI